MHPVAKLLIIAGAVLVLAGLVWHLGSTYLNLGRLPGDIAVERDGFRFYFPIVTCLVISIVLSIILTIAGRFLR